MAVPIDPMERVRESEPGAFALDYAAQHRSSARPRSEEDMPPEVTCREAMRTGKE